MRWTVFSLVVLLGSLEAQAVAQPEVTPAVQRVALEVQEAAIKLQPLYRDCTTNPQKLHLAEGLRDLARVAFRHPPTFILTILKV